MKTNAQKTLMILALILPMMLNGQPKPNVNKAQTALMEGKLDEAKEIIDATTSTESYMVNKKGEPSKNAAKAWYLRGIIYAALDTTTNASYQSLAENPFETTKVALEKFKQLDDGKKDYILTDGLGLPILFSQVNAQLAQAFINQSLEYYQKDEDDQDKKEALYKSAFYEMEKAVYLLPNDTSLLMNAGVYMGPQAGVYDRSLNYIDRYMAEGGTSSDALVQKFSIYRDKLKDYEKALGVSQELMKKFPDNPEFPRYVLDMYVKMERLPDAKKLMISQANADPKDKESHYLAGLVCDELEQKSEAMEWYKKALAIDPEYYDPLAAVAQEKYNRVRELRNERNDISGTKPADLKRRGELFTKIKDQLNDALTYWERMEKVSPDSEAVLYGLLTIYGELSAYDEAAYASKTKRLKAKMKAMGLEVD